MTIQYINTGTSPNKGNGDTLRLAFQKINNNFGQVITYSENIPTTSTSTGITGSFAYNTDYLYVCVATNTWKRIGWDNTPW